MKLEYVPDGSADAPLVRLYDFRPEEVSRLRTTIARLATKTFRSIELHDIDLIDALYDCQLTLLTNHWDQGLVQTGQPATFRCALTPETWDNIVAWMEPFAQDGCKGFQWLHAAGIPL